MFTCPDCGAESHNPNDEAEGYCGACHRYTGRPGGNPYGQLLLKATEMQDLLDAIELAFDEYPERFGAFNSLRTAVAEARDGLLIPMKRTQPSTGD